MARAKTAVRERMIAASFENGLIRTFQETIQHKNEEDFCEIALKCPKFSRSRLRRSRVGTSSVSSGARKNMRSRVHALSWRVLKNGLVTTLQETIQHKNEADFCESALRCPNFSRSRFRRSCVGASSVPGGACKNSCSRVHDRGEF